MADRLAGRVAVVTGGASGMGRATVERFLHEGARVVVADLNDESGKATVAAADSEGAGDRIRYVRTDVASEPDVEAMIAAAVEEFGRLDVVFNNAGVGGAFGALTDIELQDWDYTFAVLCTGVFLGIKHGARVLKRQGGGGSIISTASVAGLSGGAGSQAYSAAKAAVINLTQSAAVELAPHQIRVNAICPGGINTPLVNRGDPEGTAARLDELQPWPSHGTGDDIAGAALFLASDDSRFVTGHAMVVDGGLTAAGPRLRAGRLAALETGRLTGVNRGTTGQQPIIRQPEDRTDRIL